MSKKIFIVIVICIGSTLFFSCSYSPETYTYDEAEYFAGHNSAESWFEYFIRKESPQDYQDFPSRKDMSYPPTNFSFKEPVAILLLENRIKEFNEKDSKDVYRFIKLPSVKMTDRLFNAKTLVLIKYRRGENIWAREIDVFDIIGGCRIASYGGSADYIRSRPPGLKKIIEEANRLLSYPKFVNDGTDRLSTWRYYLDTIKKLDWNKPNTLVYKKIHIEKKVKSLKLMNYEEKNIKGNVFINLENGEYRIKLTDNANEYPDNDDWLILIKTSYGKEYAGQWIHVDKQGNRVGDWSKDAFKNYHNAFVLNVKDGTIVEQYSSETNE
ncbi:MAG: hypothetical protein LBL90_00350 [Prevotellaceae bacterium]|jgi:hypothetical protein|nr:hypothetical protein [Prevotellaceae bacterium]